MSHRSTLVRYAIGLLAAALALGLSVGPAQALPSGDRAERCAIALTQAKGIQTVVDRLPGFWGERASINRWVQPNGRRLWSTLAASPNRERLSRLLNLMQDMVDNGGRERIPRIQGYARQLVEDLRERREFTVTFTDASGQVVTKEVAC